MPKRARTKSKPRGRPPRDKEGTPTDLRLVAAAAKEFNQRGFDGTDTNRIARRAGFAPQTFYRWFRDKTEVFLAVYRAWEEDERAMLATLFASKGPASELIDTFIKYHKAHRVFRRSLRTLAVEDKAVRKARATSRKRQIEQIKSWIAPAKASGAEVAMVLLQMERLADAVAEGEFSDLGVEDKSVRAAIADLQAGLHR